MKRSSIDFTSNKYYKVFGFYLIIITISMEVYFITSLSILSQLLDIYVRCLSKDATVLL
jgi:hypothetical protein